MLSELFISKRYKDADNTAAQLISDLHNLIGSIDLTADGGAERAHGMLNMIEQIQRIRVALTVTSPSQKAEE